MTDAYTDEATRKKSAERFHSKYHLFPLEESEVKLLIEALSVYDELWEKRVPEESEEGVEEIIGIRTDVKRVVGRLKLLKSNF